MKLYQVKDQTGKIVGETVNLSELNSFLAAHPTYCAQTLPGEITGFTSTLPTLQEDPAKPAGDFLRQ